MSKDILIRVLCTVNYINYINFKKSLCGDPETNFAREASGPR